MKYLFEDYNPHLCKYYLEINISLIEFIFEILFLYIISDGSRIKN